MRNTLPNRPAIPDSTTPTGLWGSIRHRVVGFGNRSAVAMLDQMIVSGTSLVTTIVVGRYVGSEGLGFFALAMSILVLVNGLQASLVSTPYTVFRSRSADGISSALRAGGTLAGAVLLSAILTAIALLVATAVSLTTRQVSVVTLAWALVFTIPLFLARDFARRFDFARMDMTGALVVDVGVATLQISLLLALGVRGDLSGSSAIALIGVACATMAAFWFIRRRREFAIGRDDILFSIKHDWLFGRWLVADQLICTVLMYVMHWLLFGLIGTSATGVFTACASIAALANPLIQGIGNFLAPRFAETVTSGSRSETLRIYWRATGVMAVSVTGFTLVAIFFGNQLLRILYNDPAYAGYGVVVSLLALRLACAIPTIAAHHAVVAMECPRGSAIATLVGLIAAVCLAFPLILVYGIPGAAFALLMGTAIESALLVTVFARCIRDWNWNHEL